MRILIFGAGTIGISYGYMLAQFHEVTLYVKEERIEYFRKGIKIDLTDLRSGGENQKIIYTPKVTMDFQEDYDLIIVAVNRNQFLEALSTIQAGRKDAHLLFMLNHWDLEKEAAKYFSEGTYSIGFPSQIGGGRDKDGLNVIVFPEGTILSDWGNDKLKRVFEDSGFSVGIKPNIAQWMKVHYLQQAITGAALLKAGGYDLLCEDYKAVKDMVYAYREGLAVCRACGIDTKEIHPAKLFYYPAPFVAMFLKRMFERQEVREMILNHMKHGIEEWVYGYYEVLNEGEERGVQMPEYGTAIGHIQHNIKNKDDNPQDMKS